MSFLAIDIANLLAETKKRGAVQLREACDRFGALLDDLKKQNKGVDAEKCIAVALSKDERTILPFLFATIEFKHNKTVLGIVVIALQKIVSHQVLSEESLPAFITTLNNVANSHEEILLLKVCQISLSLVTTMNVAHDSNLCMLFSLCFRFFSHHGVLVSSTASAVLKQMSIRIFEQFDDDVQRTDAVRYFGDLCALASRDLAPRWLSLPQNHSVPTVFVFDIIDDNIRFHLPVFEAVEGMRMALSDRLAPVITRTLTAKQESFSVFIRALRIFLMLIQKEFAPSLVTEIEVILSMLLRFLQHDVAANRWHIEAVLETFRKICTDPGVFGWLAFCYRNEKQPVMAEVVQVLSRFVQRSFAGEEVLNLSPHIPRQSIHTTAEMQMWNESEEGKSPPSPVAVLYPQQFMSPAPAPAPGGPTSSPSSAAHSQRVPVLEMLSETSDNPTLTFVRAPGLALECLMGVVECVARLQLKTADDDPDARPGAVAIVRQAYESLLTALSFVLSNCSTEDVVQMILRNYQGFTNSAALLGEVTARNAFIASLCRFALPYQVVVTRTHVAADLRDETSEMTPRNIQTVKIVLNISHALLGDLDEEAWGSVMEAFAALDQVIAEGRGIATELLICAEAMNGLFAQTSSLSVDGLRALLLALKGLSLSLVKREETKILHGNAQNVVATRIKAFHHFGITRSKEIAQRNSDRLVQMWPVIVDHFLSLALPERHLPATREAGVDAYFELLTVAVEKNAPEVGEEMQALEEAERETVAQYQRAKRGEMVEKEKDEEPKRKFSAIAFEVELFLPLREFLLNESTSAVRTLALQRLLTLLQTSGVVIRVAWIFLFDMLREIGDREDVALLALAFDTVQLICTDFLDVLPLAGLLQFVSTIGCFAGQSVAVNISLTAVNLLWNVADFLSSRQEQNLPFVSVPELALRLARVASRPQASSSDADKWSAPTTSTSSAKLMAAHLPPVVAPSPRSSRGGASSSFSTLWIALFAQLKALSLDARPEIRNSSLHSILSMISGHGKIFDALTWQTFCWEISLPALSSIHEAGRSATDATIDSEIESLRGEKVKMLLHHSRNTMQKQWDETAVLAVGVVSKVVRMCFSLRTEEILPEERAIEYCRCLLEQFTIMMTAGTDEVAVAVVGGVVDFLSMVASFGDASSVSSGSVALYPSLWRLTWNAVSSCINSLQGSARSEVSSCWMEQLFSFFSNKREFFDSDHMNYLLSLVTSLLSSNWRAVLATSLEFFQCIPADDDRASAMICEALTVSMSRVAAASHAQRPEGNDRRLILQFERDQRLHVSAMGTLSEQIERRIAKWGDGKGLLSALNDALQSRLWEVAFQLVEATLAELISQCDVWDEAVHLLSSFAHSSLPTASKRARIPALVEACVVKAPEEHVKPWFELLRDGRDSPIGEMGEFVVACCRSLFSLARDSNRAREAVQCAVECISEGLKRYFESDEEEEDHVIFLLSSLRKMTCDPDCIVTPVVFSEVEGSRGRYSGRYAPVLSLLPVLLQGTVDGSLRVRQEIHECLSEVFCELELVQKSVDSKTTR